MSGHELKVKPSTTTRAAVEHDRLRLCLVVLDIVKSTELLRELGDDRYAHLIENFKDSVYEVMGAHGGIDIADTGDGFIYAFRDAEAAVGAARAMFQTNACLESSRDRPICLRGGVHAGELVLSRYGIVGIALYEAVELGNAANPDEVWLSMSAATETTLARNPTRVVTLPRSGCTSVVVLDREQLQTPLVPVGGDRRILPPVGVRIFARESV